MRSPVPFRVVCATVAALASLVASPSTQSSGLQARLEPLRSSLALPAAGGASFGADGAPELAVVGLRKLGADTPVTTDDLWHIGSITKSFTSLMVGKAVERGELTWTTTMKEMVGERAGAYGGVTVEHLLSHRSGLPANTTPAIMGPAGQGNPPLTELRQRILTEALKTTPAAAPGAQMTYSNLGYVVMAAILESRSGASWEQLVQKEVLGPLALQSAGFGAPGVLNELTQPRGHRNGTTPVEPGPFADNAPFLGPAGRLHMTLADLARWGQEHLRGALGRDGLVRAATFARLHQPVGAGEYGLGWVTDTRQPGRVIWHNGSNTMWYAVVAFSPDTRRGVVVTTNGGIGAAAGINAAAFGWVR